MAANALIPRVSIQFIHVSCIFTLGVWVQFVTSKVHSANFWRFMRPGFATTYDNWTKSLQNKACLAHER